MSYEDGREPEHIRFLRWEFFLLNVHSVSRYIKSYNLEKDVFLLATSVGQRKNSESPGGIDAQTFGFRAPMPYHWGPVPTPYLSRAESNSTIGRPKFVNPGWIDSNAELYSAEIN